MNKLEGFYELNRAGIPSVPWQQYDATASLDSNILWTIRSAVVKGHDLNLPRKVGVTAEEAKAFAEELMATLKKDDLVLYYPFFVAEKSGVMEVAQNRIVIEAVKKDLWNLVTEGYRDVTIMVSIDAKSFIGNENFLSEGELDELLRYSAKVKSKYRDIIHEGKSIFLEWSYAFVSDILQNPVGEKKLIFYEIRSVE